MENKNTSAIVTCMMLSILFTWGLMESLTSKWGNLAGFILICILITLAYSANDLRVYSKLSRMFYLIGTVVVITLIIRFSKETYLMETISFILAEWAVSILLSFFINFYIKIENLMFNIGDNYSEKRARKQLERGVLNYYYNYNWKNGKLTSLWLYYDKRGLYKDIRKTLMNNYPVRPFVFYRGMVNEFMNLSLNELIEIKFFLHEDKENKLDIINGYIKLFAIIISAFLGDNLIDKVRSEVLKNIFLSRWTLIMLVYIIVVAIILSIMEVKSDRKSNKSRKMLENIVNAAIEKKKMENK